MPPAILDYVGKGFQAQAVEMTEDFTHFQKVKPTKG